MKKALIFLLLLIASLANSQDSDFSGFVSRFDNERNLMDSIELLRYFDRKLEKNDPMTAYTDKVVFKTSNLIALSCLLVCESGGECESSILKVFDYNGNTKGELIDFEFFYSDCEFNDKRACVYKSDTMLVLVEERKLFNCITDSIFKQNVFTETYSISSQGKIKKRGRNEIDTERKHFNLSIKLLQDSDLNNKTSSELSIMRNEIYASHGYIFKSNKWRKYFKSKKWYKPEFENVDKIISPIEKENLKLIIKFEKQLNW